MSICLPGESVLLESKIGTFLEDAYGLVCGKFSFAEHPKKLYVSCSRSILCVSSFSGNRSKSALGGLLEEPKMIKVRPQAILKLLMILLAYNILLRQAALESNSETDKAVIEESAGELSRNRAFSTKGRQRIPWRFFKGLLRKLRISGNYIKLFMSIRSNGFKNLSSSIYRTTMNSGGLVVCGPNIGDVYSG